VKKLSNNLLTQLSEKMAQLIETNIGARFPQVSEQNGGRTSVGISVLETAFSSGFGLRTEA